MSIDSGIKGLEEIVSIPDGFIVLLGGTPGTGKNAFAMDYLFKAVGNGEKCLYVSLRNSEDQLKHEAERRGYDPESESVKFQISNDLMRPGTGGQVFEPEKVTEALRRNLNEFDPDRVVVDTVTKFLMIFDAEPVKREELGGLVDILKAKNCSTLMLGEVPFSMNGQPSRYEIAEFVVDGVFRLQKIDGKQVFDVLKMKGLGYSTDKYEVEITDNLVDVSKRFDDGTSEYGDEAYYAQ